MRIGSVLTALHLTRRDYHCLAVVQAFPRDDTLYRQPKILTHVDSITMGNKRNFARFSQ